MLTSELQSDRTGSGRHGISLRKSSMGLERVRKRDPVDQHVAQPDRPLEAHVVGELRPTQVGVDDKYAEPNISKSDREIGGRGRVALRCHKTCDDEVACARLDVEELKISAASTEGLRSRAQRLVLDNGGEFLNVRGS